MILYSPFIALSRRASLSLIAGIFTSTLLVACGGSSSPETIADQPIASPSPSPESFNKLYVGLTDAEGDFLTYEVGVTGLTMTRANGAVVNLLPRSTQVDFAQYVEVTEFLSVIEAPVGLYQSATMDLDFHNAQITVQDENGQAILANVIDSEGLPVNEITVNIQFNDNEGFRILPGAPAQITLDFDLAASNSIAFDGDTATVTVSPILLADTVLEAPKTFRIRGLLSDVDQEDAEFELTIQPFRSRSGTYGDGVIHVNENTRYEIDGDVYEGTEGLTVLATLDASTAIVSEGTWDQAQREFQADIVYAGRSVAWGEEDFMRATVVARDDNMLTVKGALLFREDGSYFFNDTFTVTLSDTI